VVKGGKSSPGNNKKKNCSLPPALVVKEKNGMDDIGIERNNTLYIEEIGA